MDKKTIITYAGDATLLKELEPGLVQAIPKESSEWKRQFGRVIKTVYIEAKFVPFRNDIVPKHDDLKLIHSPILHTYWTECNDLEKYKSHVKDDIEQWQKVLNGADWMVIIVEVYDIRKSNKLLPRTTVVDKIRADFAVKQGDRVISVIHPIKSESKSAESWRGLVNRIRVLVLQSYNKTLTKFEETVRTHRECRPQPNWSFCSYFLMQEELALLLEMLGLYEEALVQYDELDALFTQFVLNSTKGEHPKWLNSFTVPLQQWAGPTLGLQVTQQQRDLIRCSKLDLLQFRGYLFARQCSLLLMLCKPWEMAQRTLAFLHNSVNEMNILEVNAPEGAVACWVFLVCLEVLQRCDNYNDSAQVEAYSLYTADLWSYARDKLQVLGQLCGVVPGPGPTSQQLHLVVGLSSGMGDPPPTSHGPNPVDKLKEALSSKEAFSNYFLELSELSISTYKHIGRMRCARRIVSDLADFYIALGQADKAATFLAGAVSGFTEDGWHHLVTDTQLRLIECCSTDPTDTRYITSCAAVASSGLDNATRLKCFHKFINSLSNFAQDKQVVSNVDDIGVVKSIDVVEVNHLTQGICDIEVVLHFNSRLPGPISSDTISIALVKEVQTEATGSASQRAGSKGSSVFTKLPVCSLMDYKEDGSLNVANIVCNEPHKALKRADSQGKGIKVSTPSRHDFSICLTSHDITLNPGMNSVPLHWTAEDTGRYTLGQLSISMRGLELLTIPQPSLSFTVKKEKCFVELNEGSSELLAGLPQQVELLVHSGSYLIPQGAVLRLECSDGLTVCRTECEAMVAELEVLVPETKPFTQVALPLTVQAALPGQTDKEATAMNHTMVVSCLWCEETITASLSFSAPLKCVMRLHTAFERKYLQVSVTGLSMQKLSLRGAQLQAVNTPVDIVKSLNPAKSLAQVIQENLCVSLLWELSISSLPTTDTAINLQFSLEYASGAVSEDEQPVYYSYKCHFDIQNYKTLYVASCTLEPGKEADFCRVGTMCQLNLEVSRLATAQTSDELSLMYEVYADQTLWAVCGRAAGVITLEKETKHNVALDVMPLSQGFLTLPLVRLSKYIPAAEKDSSRPRLESFSPGQVYSASKSKQVHVLPAVGPTHATITAE